MTVLRGQLIEEFSDESLRALRAQIESELPKGAGELTMENHNQLLELEQIDRELEGRRNYWQ